VRFLGSTVRRARSAGLIEEIIASAVLDTTGYESGHASEYYSRRKGVVKSRYPKLSTVCDTLSHFYLGAVADTGPMPDQVEFKEALLMACGNASIRRLLADAAYDAESNHVLCRETLGIESIIPTNKGRKPRDPEHKPPTKYRRQMKERFPKKKYGQRWQIESAFSQDKRRFGSAVEGRSREALHQALLMRVLVHNIALLLFCLLRFRSRLPAIRLFSTEQV
jgi:transposase